MKTEIILNRLFAGSFLDDHIGHEIVNLYKDDRGMNYLYIQPYGTYHREHAGKIGYVLLVRGISGKQTVEVLGLASGLTELYNPDLSCDEMWNEQLEFLEREDVSYGGVPIIDIFDRKKEKPEDQPVYLSLKADKVMRPNRKVYLVYKGGKGIDDPNAIIVQLPKTNQAKCSLKQYFTENDVVVEFARDVLKVNVEIFPTVERETDNIDILLENDNEIVVIENKITSKINGIQVSDNKLVGTQLMKYHFKALERACNEEKDIRTYSQWQSLRKRCPKKIACYILAPNYNTINLDDYDTPFEGTSETFKCKDFYRQISYRDVYDFLLGKHQEDCYFQEMLKGMKKHTLEYHDDLFKKTKMKFIRQIRKF